MPTNYGRLRCSVVRAFQKAIKQKRNLDSFSTAKLSQIYANSKRNEEKVPDAYELVQFLPHPETWLSFNQKRKLKISRRTAIAILNSLEQLDDEIRDIVESEIQEIQLIANGD